MTELEKFLLAKLTEIESLSFRGTGRELAQVRQEASRAQIEAVAMLTSRDLARESR